MRIDSHNHFWSYDSSEFGWISDAMTQIRSDFAPSNLEPLLKASGYDGCIAVQARQSLEETRYLLRLADENEFVKGVVGWIDLQSNQAFDVEFIRHPKLVGVRHIVQAEPPNFMFDQKFRENIRRLPEYGLTYDVLIYEHQMEEAGDLVWSFPDVRFVLDHMAKPPVRDDKWNPWAKRMRKLAGHDNLYVKLSGLAFEADWPSWSTETLKPWITHVVDCFEPRRCMIGSDWPVSLCAGEYSRIMYSIEECLIDLPTSDIAMICGGTAEEFYGSQG